MGLKGDVDEVKRAWDAAPWRVRLWLALSLLLASSSIASLSETVAKWKGFFFDAIEFYKRFISHPIAVLIQSLANVEIPRGTADVIVLLMISIGANLRVAAFNRSGEVITNAFAAILGGIVLVAAVFVIDGTQVRTTSLIGALLGTIVLATRWHMKVGGATRLLWFVYLLGPFVLVGLAGAINAGLTK